MELSDLTVVVPTRNESLNIGWFLRSLPEPVQLIVVDASQDETPQQIKSFRPNNTLLIRQMTNVTAARQIGAEAAQTAWLLFTDADITFAADYFARLQRPREGDAFYGPKKSGDDFSAYYRFFSVGQPLLDRLGLPAVSGSNLLVRHSTFRAVGGFDLTLNVNEDSELGWRIKRRNYQIVFAPDLIVYARDQRRLRRGVARKLLHTLVRCTLLYTGLMPQRWRSHDWGYWPQQTEVETGRRSLK